MKSDTIQTVFNRLKNLVYDQKFEEFTLNEVAKLLKKEPKSVEDIKKITDIYAYILTIYQATEDLGTKLIELNNSDINFVGSDNYKKIESHVKDIVYYLDEFVDALTAFYNSFTFDKTRFEIKNTVSYLKAIRTKFLQKSNEFKLKIIQNKNEEENFKFFINDIITIFIQKAYSLRIVILKEKLEEALKKNG